MSGKQSVARADVDAMVEAAARAAWECPQTNHDPSDIPQDTGGRAMSDVSELVGRLRGPIKHPQQSVSLRLEAADALETLAGENERRASSAKALVDASDRAAAAIMAAEIRRAEEAKNAAARAAAAAAEEAVAKARAVNRDLVQHCAGRREAAEMWQARAIAAESRLAKLAPVVEAARGIKRAEDAKDQGEWVKCHEIMYRAIATLEAAHADA